MAQYYWNAATEDRCKMNPIVLDDIAFKPDVDCLLSALRIDADSDDADTVRDLLRQAEAVARPKAMYREAFIDDRGDDFVVIRGIKLSSRVLAVNLQDVHRVFPFAITCGTEIEEWSQSLGDALERYWADRIKEMALGAAGGALSEHLVSTFQPGKTSTMNPGSLEDWPLTEQTALFSVLGDVTGTIGVRLSDTFLMTPVKSVSGLRFPTEISFESCQLCKRSACPSRRAKYDPELFDKRYRR